MFKDKHYTVDIAAILLMAIIYSTISSFNPVSYSDHHFIYTALRYLLLNSQLIAIFLLFRVCKVRTFSALSLTAIIVGILLAINHKKMRLTGEPLSFNDLIATPQFSVVIKYVPLWVYFVIIAVVSLLFILSRIEKKWRGNEPFRIDYIILLIILIPIAFFTYQNGRLSFIKNFADRPLSVYYNNYMPSVNINNNGLLIHLMQTSARKAIPSLSLTEKKRYQQYYQQYVPQATGPRTIIYILCESCWYDNHHFGQLFSPLVEQGFQQSRAISPVYGGNTANAEFEMLTGFPSHTPYLSGIIYQEYGTVMSSHVDALPQRLRMAGYITYAAHNNDKGSWKRDVVYPKLGIARFQGFSEMVLPPEAQRPKKPTWQRTADDILLYDTAIEALKQAQGKKIFLQLVTMSTHGPYVMGNDDGTGQYATLLAQSANRMQNFTQQVLAIDPEATIVIYGDHKPALNDFFIKNGILTNDFYAGGPAVYGDVPVLIKSANAAATHKVIEQSKGKPFFCVTSSINANIIHIPLFSNWFYQQNGCLTTSETYQSLVDKAPSWAIAAALFKN